MKLRNPFRRGDPIHQAVRTELVPVKTHLMLVERHIEALEATLTILGERIDALEQRAHTPS